MAGCGDQRVAAERATWGCEEQVADAARAERRRLARDLHDSVIQTLISLHLTAQAAADTQLRRGRTPSTTVPCGICPFRDRASHARRQSPYPP